MGRIIVIEDNPVFAGYVCGLLESKGFQSVSTSTCNGARKLFSKVREDRATILPISASRSAAINRGAMEDVLKIPKFSSVIVTSEKRVCSSTPFLSFTESCRQRPEMPDTDPARLKQGQPWRRGRKKAGPESCCRAR